ncbi:NAD(P)-dependent dehydrogenase (short-subunit alcohol dehydrogenase family) [Cryobacterium sp. CAN_C3]|uniref:DUF6855 family protein n=1 Tax=Cryobacterium sp. TaxID=1926290 RepID=UPI002E08ECA3|nr:NAD(P)-dependent dehydrogenase (short-subunit alcohol dehydrogenase family) [Cryobacterium sp. CAN_C3]
MTPPPGSRETIVTISPDLGAGASQGDAHYAATKKSIGGVSHSVALDVGAACIGPAISRTPERRSHGRTDRTRGPDTIEAWDRSENNPVGGWYGLKNGFRGRVWQHDTSWANLPQTVAGIVEQS